MAITHRKPETHGPLAWLRGMYASTHAALPVRKQNNVAQSVVVDRALSSKNSSNPPHRKTPNQRGVQL